VTYDFNGVEVHVASGESAIVVTSSFGDCVSVLPDTPKVNSQIDRGIWDDSFVYRISDKDGVELVNQPMSQGEYIA
jgi:hypothetical protein